MGEEEDIIKTSCKYEITLCDQETEAKIQEAMAAYERETRYSLKYQRRLS